MRREGRHQALDLQASEAKFAPTASRLRRARHILRGIVATEVAVWLGTVVWPVDMPTEERALVAPVLGVVFVLIPVFAQWLARTKLKAVCPECAASIDTLGPYCPECGTRGLQLKWTTGETIPCRSCRVSIELASGRAGNSGRLMLFRARIRACSSCGALLTREGV
jgi:hypothetical protein